MLQSFNMLIDVESEKMQQVAAEIHEEPFEEKLQQVVAEIPFPAGFSFIPWGQSLPDHYEIQEYLPTVEQIQKQIEIAEEEYKMKLQEKQGE